MTEGLPKISCRQMYVLLFLSRLMHTMLYYSGRLGSGVSIMLTLLFTTMTEAVLSYPLIKLISGGEDVASSLAVGKKSRAFIKAMYSFYFLYISVGTLSCFARFMTMEFSNVASGKWVIITLALAAGYCAYLGIEGLARAGTVVWWTVLILVITMAAVGDGEFDFLNIVPMTESDIPTVKAYALNDLTSAWWLPMLAALSPYLNGDPKKTAAAYLFSKLVILEFLFLLVILVLWNFVEVIGYPILAIGAYAKTDFIQHFDAINMFVWSLNCVLVNGTYISIASGTENGKKRAVRVAVSAILAAVGGCLAFRFDMSFGDTIAMAIKAGGIAVLGIILPLIGLIKKSVRRIKSGCQEGSPA